MCLVVESGLHGEQDCSEWLERSNSISDGLPWQLRHAMVAQQETLHEEKAHCPYRVQTFHLEGYPDSVWLAARNHH